MPDPLPHKSHKSKSHKSKSHRSHRSDKSRRSHVADWERTQKPRTWRGQPKLLLIAFLSLISYISLPATAYFTYRLIAHPQQDLETYTVISLSALLISLILGTILSATTYCSLCHGRPFLNQNCLTHQLANKIPLLTRRASTILALLGTGRFRCMLCSTPFRLGSKSSAQP